MEPPLALPPLLEARPVELPLELLPLLETPPVELEEALEAEPPDELPDELDDDPELRPPDPFPVDPPELSPAVPLEVPPSGQSVLVGAAQMLEFGSQTCPVGQSQSQLQGMPEPSPKQNPAQPDAWPLPSMPKLQPPRARATRATERPVARRMNASGVMGRVVCSPPDEEAPDGGGAVTVPALIHPSR